MSMIHRARLNRTLTGEIHEFTLDHGFGIHSNQVMRLEHCASYFTAREAVDRFCGGGSIIPSHGPHDFPLLVMSLDAFDQNGLRFCDVLRYDTSESLIDWLVTNGHAADLSTAQILVGAGASE